MPVAEKQKEDRAPHEVLRDWKGAAKFLMEVKAWTVEDTLTHLADLEEMVERDGLDEIAKDIRNLSSRLRSLRQDYEHGAVAG